jgi:parallel beta-helix repeat protein
MNRIGCSLIVTALCTFSPSLGFSQGPLTPPGAPAATMKTLDQVEARIPVDQTHTPSGPAGIFVISLPGSYYLTDNITCVPGKDGIAILANDVTLDLNGFEIVGVAGATHCIGIYSQSFVIVRNGIVRGGSVGIFGQFTSDCQVQNMSVIQIEQIPISLGDRGVVSNCRVIDSGSSGIGVRANGTVLDCIFQGNGINVGTGCVVRRCIVQGSTGIGIVGSDATTVVGCTVRGTLSIGGQQGIGILIFGQSRVTDCITTGNAGIGILGSESTSGSVVEGCTSSNNGVGSNNSGGISMGSGAFVTNCNCESNIGPGIKVGDNSQVNGCRVNNSIYDGIVVSNFCLVRNCTPDLQQVAAGILATGSGNRIEGNNVTRNLSGIQVTGTGNIILGNTARGNSTNYVIAAGNQYGQIVDGTAAGTASVNGNSAASTIVSTDPAANYAY